jgi:hypothetical protein
VKGARPASTPDFYFIPGGRASGLPARREDVRR